MKNDTIVTSEEWLERGKWTKFLMSLPLGKSRTFKFEPIGEYRLQLIRVTAAGMSNNKNCDRQFSIIVDADREYFTITTKSKNNGQENTNPRAAGDGYPSED